MRPRGAAVPGQFHTLVPSAPWEVPGLLGPAGSCGLCHPAAQGRGEGGESLLGPLPCSVPISLWLPLGRFHLQGSLMRAPRKGEVPGFLGKGAPASQGARGGLRGSQADSPSHPVLRSRQPGVSVWPRHRKAGGLELSALWPEKIRVPGISSLAGRSEQAERFPEPTALRGLPRGPASTPTQPWAQGFRLRVRMRPRLGLGATRSGPGDGRMPEVPPGAPERAAKLPGPASSPCLAAQGGQARRPRAATFQANWGQASSVSRGLLPRSKRHYLIGKPFRKELQSPWEWEWKEISKGPPGSLPPVPEQGRHHASGCLPAERPLGGQLAFVSFSGRPG